jgi:hypothetical protein
MNLQEIEAQLLSLMHGKFSSLSLSFNNHASNYCDVQTYMDNYDGYRLVDWVNAEEKSKAIATNSVWELHWYPNSPVGFNVTGASSLTALLAHVFAEEAAA